MEITIGTFNVQSVKGNRIYLKQLLHKLDICCVQEHCLQNIEANMTVAAKSVDDDCPELSVVAKSCYFLEKGDRR